MPIAAAIPAIIGAGAGIAQGAIGSSAARRAGKTQSDAALSAANYAKNQQNQALGTINGNLSQELGLLSPYTQAGKGAAVNLSSLLSTPGQGLLAPFTGQFHAPTAEEAANTPGYQFQVGEAQKGLERSAAAKGGLLNGGTAKALDTYTQGLASENYGNTYNRAFNEYLQNYNQFQNNQANQYNRLMGLTGVGLNAAGTGVNALGQATGQTVGTLLDTSHQVGQQLNNAGAATASGQVGSANAWNGALGTAANAGIDAYYQLSGDQPPSSKAIGGPGTALWQPYSGGAPTGTPGVAGVPPGYSYPANTSGYVMPWETQR